MIETKKKDMLYCMECKNLQPVAIKTEIMDIQPISGCNFSEVTYKKWMECLVCRSKRLAKI